MLNVCTSAHWPPYRRMKWRTLAAFESSEWPSMHTDTGTNVKFNSIHANDRHTRQSQMCRQSKAVCGHGYQHEHQCIAFRAPHSPPLSFMSSVHSNAPNARTPMHFEAFVARPICESAYACHPTPSHALAAFRVFRLPLSVLGFATSENQPGLIYFAQNLLNYSR